MKVKILIVAVFCAYVATAALDGDSSTPISRPKIAEHKKYMFPYQHMQKSMIQTIVFIQDYNKNLQCLGALLDKNLVAYPRDCWNSSLMLQAKVRCNDNTHIYIQMKAPKTEICQISRGVNIIESELLNPIDTKCWGSSISRFTNIANTLTERDQLYQIRVSKGFYFKSFSVGKIYAKDNFFEVRYNMLPPEYRQKLANVEDVPEEPNNILNGEPIFHDSKLAGLYVKKNARFRGICDLYTRLHKVNTMEDMNLNNV